MKKLFLIAILSLAIIAPSFAAHAEMRKVRLCEELPTSPSARANFAATNDDRNANYVRAGDTAGFLKGRTNRYFVNNHNGAPIIVTHNCEGKLLADKGPRLKGLLITTPGHFRGKMGGIFNTPGFFIENLPILTDDSSIKGHMEDEYKNQPINEELLNGIIRDTIVFMRDKNQPVVDVYFPEQDVTDGFIVALVKRAVLDKIILNGNEYYSDEEIARFVTSQPGQYVWSDILSKDMRWINSYPYRQTDVIFKPGEKPGYTDMILETKDMYPFRIFGGVDNYGSRSTGQNQAYLGFSYGDLWDLDHELIYSFGSSFQFDQFNSHTLQYIAPIPDLRHKLSFTGNMSFSEPDSAGPVTQSGTNTTINIDYEMPLYDYGFRGFVQTLSTGIDYKILENDIEFGGISVFNSKPEIAQAYITYEASKASAKTLNSFSGTLVGSPGDITGNNSETQFNIARPNADPNYFYYKGFYQGSYTDEFTELTFGTQVRGQAAPEALLASEQVAISGPGAVRGFASNSVRRDSGLLSTFEVASPYVPVLDTFLPGAIFRDRVQGFVFYDKGWGWDRDNPANAKVVILDSAGVGARFGLGNNLSGVIEYGQEIGDEFKDGKDSKLHFRVNASY